MHHGQALDAGAALLAIMMVLLSASGSLAASTGCTAANSGRLNDYVNFNTRSTGSGSGIFSIGDVLTFTYSGNFVERQSYGIRITYYIFYLIISCKIFK